MAVNIEPGGALAQAIQGAVQPRLMENGWVVEENDTTLSEYVTMMIVNGKTQQQVISELGTDLLGVGEDDPAVTHLAKWLFQEIPTLDAQVSGKSLADQGSGGAAVQQTAEVDGGEQDANMDDASPTSGIPSGPKAMRNGGSSAGGRGRDRRMIGQLNRQMDRAQDDPLRRIKGAAGGQAGRINSHAGRGLPRGPRGGSVANNVQRMMNGRPGQQNNGMMQQQGGMPMMSQDQQMQFLQMMEAQSQMMAQMFNGQVPNVGGFNPNFQNKQTPGHGKSLFERIDKRQNGNASKGGPRQHIHNASGNVESSMDVDQGTGEDGQTKRKDPFDTVCHFNTKCTVASCQYAHQSPAAPPGAAVDLTDRCAFGAACENRKCSGKHPSPAQRRQHLKEEVDCKFYPNCANPACPFKHPDMPPCRNGADCTVEGCKFSHSKIVCRYNPCLNPGCVYKHAEGQRRGKFEDKVWTADGTSGEGFDRAAAEKNDKADRFRGFSEQATQGEELILPSNGTVEQGQEVEPQIIT